MKKHNSEVDARIEELLSRLFTCSASSEEKDEELSGEEAYKPYVTRESYFGADAQTRKKIFEFARNFDQYLLKSIMEWEAAEGKTFSRISARARFLARSEYRKLRGR